MTERLPVPNGPRIRDTSVAEADLVVLPAGELLARIHPLAGPHPVAWNRFRGFGPTSSRFDHHTRPRREHATRRIAYVTWGADAFTTAIAELFQDESRGVGPVDRRARHPSFTTFELDRAVRLLDLDGGWVTRAGGNQAIRTGSRLRARDWARAIHRHHPDIEGLAYGSSVWGPGRCAALWERAEPAIPARPSGYRMLDDPALDVPLANAAADLGTYTI